MILHTDYTDFTESRGFSFKKPVFVRVIREIRVQKVLTQGRMVFEIEPAFNPAGVNL